MSLFEIAKRIGDAQGITIYTPSAGNVSTESIQVAKGVSENFWGKIMAPLYGVPQDGDFNAYVDTYHVVAWVYTAIWCIYTSIAALPLRLYKPKGKASKFEVVEDGELYRLLVTPNPFDSLADLISLLVVYLETSGNGYWEKTSGRPGSDGRDYIPSEIPAALYTMESQFVTIEPDPMKKIAGYRYEVGANKATLPPASVIHFKYPNPKSPYYGQGTVAALQASLITDLNREAYNQSLFENEARPDVVIKHTPDAQNNIRPLMPAERDEIAARWSAAFRGPRKARRPVVLPSGVEIQPFTEITPDMGYGEMEKSLRERILGAFGVPPALVGLFEYANYANSREQIKIFYTSTITPKLQTIADALNRALIRPIEPDWWVEFDITDIPALDENPKEKSERLNGIFDRGGLTLGEYREAQGLDNPPNDPAMNMRFIMSTYVPLTDVTNPLPTDGELSPEDEAPVDGEDLTNDTEEQ